MSDLDDLRKLARAFRAGGQGILAHTIEAGLDEALGTLVADGERLVPMDRAELELIGSLNHLASLPEGRTLLPKVQRALEELNDPQG